MFKKTHFKVRKYFNFLKTFSHFVKILRGQPFVSETAVEWVHNYFAFEDVFIDIQSILIFHYLESQCSRN